MDAPVVIDASDLAATVERARALLDDGDVIAARLLAGGVYDQAKAAAGYAARMNAGRHLVEKARRLQGDALLIEARAKERLADEYDAAQEAGAARKKGRVANVSNENICEPPPATVEELGLTRQEIHDARKLRDAERREPGIVERAIAARLEAGLEPSRRNLRAVIGTNSATKEERGHNLYETPVEGIHTLLAVERFLPRVYEPSVGKGAIMRPLEDAGYDVAISDLIDYGAATRHGEVQGVVDFLNTRKADGDYDIVTNPPYGDVLNTYVAHALRVHRPRKMALLLNLNFLCGSDNSDRNSIWNECPPSRVLVFSRRLPMMHRDGWEGERASSSMNTAWFIWERRADGSYGAQTKVNRIDFKDHADSPALCPVADEELARLLEAAPLVAGPCVAAPQLRWVDEKSGRLLAMFGEIEFGAVYPKSQGKAEWLRFLDAKYMRAAKAKTVDDAKAALEAEFAAFLTRAGMSGAPEIGGAR